MELQKEKKVLISGASIAGLSSAYWMNRLGYKVTVVEMAGALRTGGAAVDVREGTIDIARRMGIFEQLKSNRLHLEMWKFKTAEDLTEGTMMVSKAGEPQSDDDIEIERDKLVHILFDALKDNVEFLFGNSITALHETADHITATFKDGTQRAFDLVLGCDGLHSGVRKIWFGHEAEYAHFLQHYFSLTIVNKLLIRENTAQMYNVPGKVIMLNAYKGKTDIVFCFFSEKELSYDYRDAAQQRDIILEQFAGESWRAAELLEEVQQAGTAYFDQFCQIRMPAWTKGRVALVGDAAYAASPAAGMGASLAMNGAAALADALEKHNGNFEAAFQEYDQHLRPFMEEVQDTAVIMLQEHLIPKTEEAIRKRNAQGTFF